MKSQRVYRPDERSDEVVFFDPPEPEPNGIWRMGELRQWLQDGDGEWWGGVQYRPDGGSSMLGNFPASRIRAVDQHQGLS